MPIVPVGVWAKTLPNAGQPAYLFQTKGRFVADLDLDLWHN
jgi:hypothetical protein